MRRVLTNLVVSGIAMALIGAENAGEPPPAYELHLVYVFEAAEPESLFVIGNSGFRTVASLKAFLASLPAGTKLTWRPGCLRMGGESLLSSEEEMEEFRRLCLDHEIDFVLVPSG